VYALPRHGPGDIDLGGTPSSVTCPWCEGGGLRLADIDAQARWLDVQAVDERAGDPPEAAPED